MTSILIMYIQLFYIVLTESLFLQFLCVTAFYIVSWFIKNPRHNWYYPEDTDA